MKVYIAGKITDEPNFVKKFKAVETELENAGYETVNPVTLPHNHGRSWEEYMAECLNALKKCDAIYLIPNWTRSKGAKIEVYRALELGLHFMDLELKKVV